MNMHETTPPNTETALIFQSRDELAKVELTKVVYFESNSNYTKVFFVNGSSLTINENLSSVEKLIEERLSAIASKFHRVGRSIVINIDYLFQINAMHQQLILNDFVSPKPFVLKASKVALRNLKTLFADRAIWEEVEENQY